MASSAFLPSGDLAAVLVLAACERAASAIATAASELTESGLATEAMTAVLLKHFLVHFSSLQQEFERLIGPIEAEIATDLLTRERQPAH